MAKSRSVPSLQSRQANQALPWSYHDLPHMAQLALEVITGNGVAIILGVVVLPVALSLSKQKVLWLRSVFAGSLTVVNHHRPEDSLPAGFTFICKFCPLIFFIIARVA